MAEYGSPPINPKQPSGQAWVLSSTRLWPSDPSGMSALKHRPGATDYSSRHPSLAVLGGLLFRQPRTVQGLGKPYLIRGYLSGVDHDAKAGESRPHGQLLLVRRKFGSRRLSRLWAGDSRDSGSDDGPVGKPHPQGTHLLKSEELLRRVNESINKCR